VIGWIVLLGLQLASGDVVKLAVCFVEGAPEVVVVVFERLRDAGWLGRGWGCRVGYLCVIDHPTGVSDCGRGRWRDGERERRRDTPEEIRISCSKSASHLCGSLAILVMRDGRADSGVGRCSSGMGRGVGARCRGRSATGRDCRGRGVAAMMSSIKLNAGGDDGADGAGRRW